MCLSDLLIVCAVVSGLGVCVLYAVLVDVYLMVLLVMLVSLGARWYRNCWKFFGLSCFVAVNLFVCEFACFCFRLLLDVSMVVLV